MAKTVKIGEIEFVNGIAVGDEISLSADAYGIVSAIAQLIQELNGLRAKYG